MEIFLDNLWSEYPAPRNLSIWGGDNITTYPVEDLDKLIDSCIKKCASDIMVTDYFTASSMYVTVPSDCVVILSAKLADSFPFQGNRLVKWTFDKGSRRLYLRYFPANVTYRRHLRKDDLDTLSGDRLNYINCWLHWKMAEKELIYLRTVNMSVDNATIDLQYLQQFATENQQAWKDYKENILPYASVV